MVLDGCTWNQLLVYFYQSGVGDSVDSYLHRARTLHPIVKVVENDRSGLRTFEMNQLLACYPGHGRRCDEYGRLRTCLDLGLPCLR